MTFFPDDYIEHWGNVYQSMPALSERGIQFDTFLLYPTEFIDLVADDDPLPLLPMQQAVMHDLAVADHDAHIPKLARRRGHVFIEPLRHHAWTPHRHGRATA